MTSRGSQGCERSGNAVFRSRNRNRAEQLAHQTIQFGVRDQMCGLLSAQRSSQNPRKTKHCRTTTSHAVGGVVLADQLTFNAKHSGLQGEKADVLPGELFFHLSDFLPRFFLGERMEKSTCWLCVSEVTGLVPGCG